MRHFLTGAFRRRHGHRRSVLLAILVAILLVLIGVFMSSGLGVRVFGGGGSSVHQPPSHGTFVCGSVLLEGPSTQPAGSVLVPVGDNTALLTGTLTANTTYYFDPGLHTIDNGTNPAATITPASGDTFVGGPGAVLSGSNVQHVAFSDTREISHVTIEYLTIEAFAPSYNDGVVQPGWDAWTLTHDTVAHNYPGMGVEIGTNGVLSDSCLAHNGQEGAHGFGKNNPSPLTGGASNVTFTNNEIAWNDECDWEDIPVKQFPTTIPAACNPSDPGQPAVGASTSCGCADGSKFWRIYGGLIKGNYYHDNYNNGLWLDTDNDGLVIEDNYISNNYAKGLVLEISYNVLVEHNTFVNNAYGTGPGLGVTLDPAIYDYDTGGYADVPNPAGISTVTIDYNRFVNNYDGVSIYEKPNRYCSDGHDQFCTLENDPATGQPMTVAACAAKLTGSVWTQYFDLCQWKAQNISVEYNTFVAGSGANRVGLYAATGNNTSPYYPFVDTPHGAPEAITASNNNLFDYNTYLGPALGDAGQWTGTFYKVNDNSPWGQNVDLNHAYSRPLAWSMPNWSVIGSPELGYSAATGQDQHSTCNGNPVGGQAAYTFTLGRDTTFGTC